MARDSAAGPHFDPQAVELKFLLHGHNGIFLPLAVDLENAQLHWLDTFSKGNFAFNNVSTSNAAISKICPEMMHYFASGARASIFDLALLQAAARGGKVFLRAADGSVELFEREAGEERRDFLRRLRSGRGIPGDLSQLASPCLAVLVQGDVELPAGAEIYALFRDQLSPTLAAADLI